MIMSWVETEWNTKRKDLEDKMKGKNVDDYNNDP